MDRARDSAGPAIGTWGWAMSLAVAALLAGESIALGLNVFGVLEQALEKDAAFLLMVISLQSIAVALAGLRTGARWAWNGVWVLFAVLSGVGVIHSSGGELTVGVMHLAFAAAVLVAQLLSARGLARS